MRGSIPLYWHQEGGARLKPDILVQHYDPLYYATRLHFQVDFSPFECQVAIMAAASIIVATVAAQMRHAKPGMHTCMSVVECRRHLKHRPLET